MASETCETCANFVREKSYPRKVGTCALIHGSGGDRHEKVPRVAPIGWAWLQVPPDFGCLLHQPKDSPDGE